jgi:hypothetical protein
LNCLTRNKEWVVETDLPAAPLPMAQKEMGKLALTCSANG